MAYISSEKVKEIRNSLKKELPNLKFSVRTENYSKVIITVKSGDVDFFSEYKTESRGYFTSWHINSDSVINDFTGSAKETIKKISKIAYSQGWYDESDSMTDYFNTAYYVVFNIGEMDNFYALNQVKKAS